MDHGDNITVANAAHSCSPAWVVQFTETTQLLVEFFVVKDHLRDDVLIKISQLTCRGRGRCIQVDRRCSVLSLFSTKLMMMYDDVYSFHPATMLGAGTTLESNRSP